MSRAGAALRFVLAEFAPLVVFWALALTVNLKAAIAGSVAALLVGAALKFRRRQPFTRLYVVVGVLTVGFGIIDLCVATPFLLVYEAPITNALTGAAFVWGAFGERPMLQEVAEARSGVLIRSTGETRRFFRLFTLLWAGYFFLKAAGYVWIAAALPMTQALALRSLLGGVSLAIMIGLSVTQGRRLFFLCRRLGLLGPEAPVEAGAE